MSITQHLFTRSLIKLDWCNIFIMKEIKNSIITTNDISNSLY